MKRKRRIGRLILLALLLAFVIIQFVPVDRSTPEIDPEQDFIAAHDDLPSETATLLKVSCYDCHSYQTKYPWYSYVAPVSWWLGDHIKEGREHLNFSVWTTYPASDKEEIYEEIAEEVGEKAMPLKSYLITHTEARLTDEERSRIVNYMEEKHR